MNKQKTILILIIILTALIYLVIKNLRHSIILKGFDRLNIVVYSQSPVFYSLSPNNISYIVPFQADYEISVPGGYGIYRLGAIGKLAYLEKKPDIIQKTFSSAVSSFIDIYFYPKSTKVYYGNAAQPAVTPSMLDILFSQSNSTWLDRVFLVYLFSNVDKNKYKMINDLPIIKKEGRLLFDDMSFFKENQGFLYDKKIRELGETVQIMFIKNYQTAQLISRILEGEGVRVIDISEGNNDGNSCIVTQKGKFNATANNIIHHLKCLEGQGNPNMSDIILSMGNLEEDWNIE